MGVSADNRRKPRSGGIEIQRIAVMQHVEGVTVERNHFRSGQVGASPECIDVAAYGRDRGQFPKRIQNQWVADVAGVENMVDAAQGFDRFGAQQTVGIGNHADQRAGRRGHKPINSRVRGSR